jgi:hypothetical protein
MARGTAAGAMDVSHFARSMRNEPSCISYELPCGHDVMIDLPERTAAIIEDAATRGSSE